MPTATLTSSGARRPALRTFLASSIGQKLLVAITGIILLLFLIGHLAGNLMIFAGQDAINTYALKLHELGLILWAARIGLLIALFIHIVAVIKLSIRNHKGKPIKYGYHTNGQTTVFARTMRITGVIILAFVAFHLAHFTFMSIHPEWKILTDPKGYHDVYSMVILGFSSPIVSGLYILAVGLLTFHLSHGVASVFQTLGLSNKKTRPFYEKFGLIFSWSLFIGFTSIPLAVLFGFLNLPNP